MITIRVPDHQELNDIVRFRGDFVQVSVSRFVSSDRTCTTTFVPAEPGRTPTIIVDRSRSPRLLQKRNGSYLWIDFHREVGIWTPFASRSSDLDNIGKDWVAISERAGDASAASGRPIETRTGDVLVPVVWNIPEATKAEVVIYATRDGGATWEERGKFESVDDAALVEAGNGHLVAICRQSRQLLRSVSTDGGRTWSALQPMGIETHPGAFAFVRGTSSGELGLAWTDPAPDSTVALPPMQQLRFALSKNDGKAWQPTRSLALNPGHVPLEPALLLDKDALFVAFIERYWGSLDQRILCMEYQRDWLTSERRTLERTQTRYGIAPEAAREALRILSAHTIHQPGMIRPPWAESPSDANRPLFVDGYFMRALARAHAVFDSLPAENPEWFDPKAGLETALRWGDQLVQKQDSLGYFPLGYGAIYLADMAAALGIFPALEPYAGEERLRRYEACARRFASAMERDGMVLQSGAIGIGWPGTYIRVRRRARHDPYLVSTALAGIELYGWLYHREGKPADRDKALRALDFTLSQLQPDGTFPRSVMIQGKTESHITAAAYVQEGWMAADVLLNDPQVLSKLKAALPPHIGWLLKTQQPDGGWGGPEDGEFARTPAIVDFLIWYDQRCESRPDIREAIRRGGLRFVDPKQLEAIGFYTTRPYVQVERAIAGRALVALSRERFVL